jgi:hypothetical protein
MSLIDSTEPPVFADKRLILVLTSAYGWCVPGGLGASAGKVRKPGAKSWMRKSRLSRINLRIGLEEGNATLRIDPLANGNGRVAPL